MIRLKNMELTLLGRQGPCEYAQDQRLRLRYRFLHENPMIKKSWKLVAT